MFAQRSQMKPAIRSILALSGLLLMIASFIWMQRIPKPGPTTRAKTARPPTTPEPFAVVVLDPGHGGQVSCGGHFSIRPILKVKVSPNIFRKRSSHARELWIGAQGPNNFL